MQSYEVEDNISFFIFISPFFLLYDTYQWGAVCIIVGLDWRVPIECLPFIFLIFYSCMTTTGNPVDMDGACRWLIFFMFAVYFMAHPSY